MDLMDSYAKFRCNTCVDADSEKALHREEKWPWLIPYIQEIIICFPTISYAYFSPVTVIQLLVSYIHLGHGCCWLSQDAFQLCFCSIPPFRLLGLTSYSLFSCQTKPVESLNNVSLAIWGATWGGHITYHLCTHRVLNKLNMITCAWGPRREAWSWDEGMVSPAHTFCIQITF